MPRLWPSLALAALLLLPESAAAQAPLNLPTAGLDLPVFALNLPQHIEVQETAQELRVELAADVLFDFDKADIRPDAAATLSEAAQLIREKARGPVRVEGHTDAKGGDAYNQKLSERRAMAVAAWLAGKGGLKGTVFRTAGFGARQPVAPNRKTDGSDDPEGRQKNRRVSLVMTK